MGQVSSKLRRSSGGYAWFCRACNQGHPLPSGWTFNGDLEKPTFSPSFRHAGKKTTRNERGEWTGDWVRDADGNPVDEVCHYILTDGIVNYCSDCTHDMAGQSVPLPDLPDWLRDEDFGGDAPCAA